MGSKIQMTLTRTNIKNILFTVKATNQYVLMTSLENLLNLT